jgi:methionine sulfoxide reductase catalytic subunit
MLIRRPPEIRSSEITDEAQYWNRREFLKAAGLGMATLGSLSPAGRLASRDWSLATADDKLTPYEDITGYNNYYEFGTDKGDPKANATHFRTKPWKIEVAGEVKRPATYDLDDFLRPFTPAERVYRLRCVEAWSMVIPWLGIPLKDVIDRLEPTSNAKFVEFTTLLDPQQMPGQRGNILPWPYVEGLRMDEARHPLTLLATGLYGKPLPGQNGAPIRLIVPWKYGFKGGKSIVKIRFLENQPSTTWNIAAPNEYGFYANVNPEVDHPRWSQARERRVGEFFKRKTLMFNGYADQVASLYSGMDLRRNF